ncbi:MAG: ATPase P [Desulfobacterales bacterium]
MIQVTIPGYPELKLHHLVLDYNGTLAVDGVLLPGVAEALSRLAADLEIHVVTADTFGKVQAALAQVPCTVTILPPGSQDIAKLNYIRKLGCQATVCMGNGRNDRMMLKAAALGVAVILAEGAAVASILAADIVCSGIREALELIANPLRLTATLRA